MKQNRIKMLLSLVMALAMICMTVIGCAGSNTAHNTSDNASVEDTQSSDAQTEEEAETEQTQETGPDLSLDEEEETVDTQFFRIKLPQVYTGNVTYHYFQDDENGMYSLEVCEITSENEGSGGILFTIDVQSEEPDYLDAVPCEYLGKLISEEGDVYYAVLMYPSDVQFGPETEEAYVALYDRIGEVISGFSAADGYSFENAVSAE